MFLNVNFEQREETLSTFKELGIVAFMKYVFCFSYLYRKFCRFAMLLDCIENG